MRFSYIAPLVTLILPHRLEAADSGLIPYVFDPIPLGSVKPQGWIRDQMQLMADGLGGHHYDFYRSVSNSTWIGGALEYSSLDEAWPYWFNAIVPLAYGIDDARLKKQVNTSIDYILSHQFADGWIGPESTPQTRFFWPRTLVLMGLTQFIEAEPNMAPQVLPHLYKFLNLSRAMLADDYLGYVGRNDSKFDYHWGITRSQDMILSLEWLYDNYPEGNEQLLLDVMKYFNDAAWDWAYFYSEGVFPKADLDIVPPLSDDLFWYFHGVNSAMGLKAPAVVRRFTHNETLLEVARRGYNWTFEYHGSPSGTIIGDEPWSGLSPTRGSELCTTVETMFSLGYNYRALGDSAFADRAELAAFNALPAAVAPDWWSHQYMTEINQPFSHNLTGNPFSDVNTMGQTFGLEPNYPCCTVNHPQGYPKFISSGYVKVGSNGIGHAQLFPSILTTSLGDNAVTIDCDTLFPFANTLSYTVESKAPFEFFIRVPNWANLTTSSIAVNGNEQTPLKPDPATGMHQVSVGSGTTKINYTLGTDIRLEPRQRNTINIYHGALLYAISINGSSTSFPPRTYNTQQLLPAQYTLPETKDHIIENTTAWNIAIDPSTLVFSTLVDKEGYTLPNPIFAQDAPPGKMVAKGCYIAWGIEKGVPSDPPDVGQRACLGGSFDVTLRPYGASKLHMAELPTVKLT